LAARAACPACHSPYPTDAVFCRMCGQQRVWSPRCHSTGQATPTNNRNPALRSALDHALQALLLYSVVGVWRRLVSRRRNALTVMAVRGRGEAVERDATLCRVITTWRWHVLGAVVKSVESSHRDALRRAVGRACRLHHTQLAPEKLHAILAVWRLRARTAGLAAWRWANYTLVLLRATIEAWHLAIFDLRTTQSVQSSRASEPMAATPPGASPTRRGPAIRLASRTRAKLSPPVSPTELLESPERKSLVSCHSALESPLHKNPAAARRAASSRSPSCRRASPVASASSPRRRASSASPAGSIDRVAMAHIDLGPTRSRPTSPAHLRQLTAAGFECEDLRLRSVRKIQTGSNVRASSREVTEQKSNDHGKQKASPIRSHLFVLEPESAAPRWDNSVGLGKGSAW